jgi:hypothetical protein
MLNTGTFSAPLLRSDVPPNISILHLRIACRVKDTSTAHHYELYARTCANGSMQKEFVNFTDSYFPVASIESICVLLNIVASSNLLVSILDISNTFLNGIIFDMAESIFISLPPLYLDWFCSQWHDFNLPSLNP